MGRLSIAAFLLIVSLFAAQPAAAITAEVYISDTQIPVGGSVWLSADGQPGDLNQLRTFLEALYAGSWVAPGLSGSDNSGTVQVSFSAPGSIQIAATGQVSWCHFCASSPPTLPVAFTYITAGSYRIDYEYSASATTYPVGAVFDSPAMDVYVAGPFLGYFSESLSGSGHFDVTVGSVPEISTWAMLILGFFGLSFMGHQWKDEMDYPSV